MDAATRKQMTEQLARHQAEAKRIGMAFKTDEKGRFTIPAEMHADYMGEVKAATEIKGLLDAAGQLDDVTGYLEAPEGQSVAGQHYGQGGGQAQQTEVKDFGSMLLESDAFQAYAQRLQNGGGHGPISIHAQVEGKSIYNFTGGTVTHQTLGQVDNLGIQERMLRKDHIRDLFPKSSTRASVLYGVRETGWVNNARQVNQRYAADGINPATGADTDVWGNAPKSKITLTPVLFPIAGIKHSLDAHKHILSDEPRLRTFLNTRMLDGVKYAEDYDLLHSVGSGEQLTGLFNTPGIQSYTGLAADNYDVQVRRAITLAQIAEYDPTGLVLSPSAFERIETEEGTDGHLRVAVSVAIGAEKRVWRLPVVVTTAMPDARFLIGSFGMGAQLHDRENVSVTVSSEHANNFTEGIVTFLAEERVGLEVVRPESFVVGSWTTPV